LNAYNRLAAWLQQNDMRPADLWEPEGRARLDALPDTGAITSDRLLALLEDEASVLEGLGAWKKAGGWVLPRSNASYPAAVRRRMRHRAPALLYGVGDPALLGRSAIAVAGSQDAGEAALAFARRVVERCAGDGVPVVAGGRGGITKPLVDMGRDTRASMVGVLPAGLGAAACRDSVQSAIDGGRMVLVSAVAPTAAPRATSASGVRLMYALATGILVVESRDRQGQTWAAAMDHLQRVGRGAVRAGRLLVRAEAPLSAGNRALIEAGARPFSRRMLRSSRHLLDWLQGPSDVDGHRDPSPLEVEQMADAGAELFPRIWPTLRQLLDRPRSAKDVRDMLADVRLGQARDWLMTAVDRGLALRSERPVRYRLPEASESEAAESTADHSDTVPSNGQRASTKAVNGADR
jgi:predicted Rossmann fold nucleotide-binding protein DprA/Smf involved in DNA uptake